MGKDEKKEKYIENKNRKLMGKRKKETKLQKKNMRKKCYGDKHKGNE